ncbi:MAG TPA: chloride channel protein [Vicinamibacterales bacterium]|nr:chloride channel protein [Vicinamibacterales bacterium]
MLDHPLIRRYTRLVRADLSATYSRDLHKWLIVAPIIGVVTGLVITLIAKVILIWMWPRVLQSYLAHPAVMIPGLVAAFTLAGLIMQYATPDPDEHSTEEIIRSYHEHQGHIQMKPFVPKLLAAAATVGFGGSAALEGPSIYGGGALGSWLWSHLRHVRRFKLEPRDRRIMLISGAAAGMAAVFRAPLTGLVFALEMPYKDDLAHEALLPSLIASVVAYITLASFLGAQPIFDFLSGTTFSGRDLFWCALLGIGCGLIAMTFCITFRRMRGFVVGLQVPHWVKMAAGGALTGVCGLIFLAIFGGQLVPIGANYEAVPDILLHAHSSAYLLSFAVLKLAATLFTLGVGGVSAMFVPLFLTGGILGVSFAQSVVHSPMVDLYAAVGMAAFIAGCYKTPLTAVVFVAEATGGHAYIIPSLIGAAIAYGVSGEASVSGDQRLHEAVKVGELRHVPVSEVMCRSVVTVDAGMTVREFASSVGTQPHTMYPVYEDTHAIGVIGTDTLVRVPAEQWEGSHVGALADRHPARVPEDMDLEEALRLLTAQHGHHLLLVEAENGTLTGVVTKSDVLRALTVRGPEAHHVHEHQHAGNL